MSTSWADKASTLPTDTSTKRYVDIAVCNPVYGQLRDEGVYLIER